MGSRRATLSCLVIAWLATPLTARSAPALRAPAPRAPTAAPRTPAPATPKPRCAGEYAEDLAALSTAARVIEGANPSYSYAVRTSATYECVSYGSDGNLKKTRAVAMAYGTAFGVRHDGPDTLLLTNEHVADWPAVTDEDHPVDGVPGGCKRIADTLKIVDDDHDDFAADDVPLTRAVVDPALDVAVLRAHTKLAIIPWRIGRSAALVARNIVQVKGFPLGEFQATNVGKVVSPYDHDVQGERNHDDFVIDALLTSGGSGSPVFAVSCKTGEFELVGIFHARYTGASALNVVVAIDQVRELMTTLKRSPRPAERLLDAAARTRLLDSVRRDPDPPFFLIGPLVASLRVRGDGAIVFAVYASDFPRTSGPVLAIEDLAGDDARLFGKPGAIYLGGAHGLHAYAAGNADAEIQALLSRTLIMLREAALAAFDYREAARTATGSRTAFNRIADMKRTLGRTLQAQRDTAQAVVDLVGREATKTTGPALGIADVEAGPPAAAALVHAPG